MGSLFAARLTKLADVTLIGHWPAQITAVQQNGLTLIQPDGQQQTVTPAITNNPTEAAPADIAFILVKSSQTQKAAHTAAAVLKPEGTAVTLQNGLGNGEKLMAVLGRERVIQGVTSEGATLVTPGVVRHAGPGLTYLADQPRSRLVAQLLQQAGFQVKISADVNSLLWGKLVINTAINPLTAVLDVPNGYLAENPAARAIMEAAARETAQVAQAAGISLPFAEPEQEALAVARATAANVSSMLQDVRRGAPTEIEAICGAVIRYGRRHNIATPINQALYRLVCALEIYQQTKEKSEDKEHESDRRH